MIDAVSQIIPSAGVSPAKPKTIEDAAKQFEALLIGQMLRSVRETGWGDEDDSSSPIMLDVADQGFSRMLATNGGFGMARLIVNGLKHGEAK